MENSLRYLIDHFELQRFIFDLFLAYGNLKSTIKRLQRSGLHVSIDALKTAKEIIKHAPPQKSARHARLSLGIFLCQRRAFYFTCKVRSRKSAIACALRLLRVGELWSITTKNRVMSTNNSIRHQNSLMKPMSISLFVWQRGYILKRETSKA